MDATICCFIGHRTIIETEELKNKIHDTVKKLIVNSNVDRFLFGSKSQFDRLALEIVSQEKEKYPHVKRIYVRAEFPFISEYYKDYLLKKYDETYYPEKILGAKRSVYIERNFEMINRSTFCVFYYNQNYIVSSIKKPKKDLGLLNNRNSGTKIAYNYALKNNKIIITKKSRETLNFLHSRDYIFFWNI